MSYSGNSELWALEQGAPNYNRMLVRRFARALPEPTAEHFTVLDFGAGIGTVSKLWIDEGMGPIHCYEPDVVQCNQIIERGIQAYSELNKLPTEYDLVFSSNVLEHIEDDLEVLVEIKNLLLKNSGILVIYVPAFQILYSAMDEKVGHYRRYSKKKLSKTVKKAGYEVITCEYVDSLGFFAALAVRILKLNVGVATNQTALKLYDDVILPMSLFLDRIGLKRIFGKNLILFARKAL
jgi:SAM-dependent methyltransferase